MSTPTVSIVMAHYRRVPLLRRTLMSIQRQRPNHSIELVVVNDDLPNIWLQNLLSETAGFASVRLIDTNRTLPNRNQAVPANIGFRAARGEIIIFQNPECFHVGPVVDGLVESVRSSPGKPYHCVRCIQLGQNDAVQIDRALSDPARADEIFALLDHPYRPEYVSAARNPRYFYFCAAMFRKDLIELGGLEESFTYANSEDDFHARLCRMNGWDMRILDEAPFRVLHQWHERPEETGSRREQTLAMGAHLRDLIKQIDRGERPALANAGNPDWGTG